MWTGEQQETRQYTRNSGRDGSIVLEQRWEMTRKGGAGWRVAEVESVPERVGQESRIWRRRQKGGRVPSPVFHEARSSCLPGQKTPAPCNSGL